MSNQVTHYQRILLASLLPVIALAIGLQATWSHIRFSLEQQGGSLLGVALICSGLLFLSGFVLFFLWKKDPAGRVIGAMDACQANVMITDNQMKITYLNRPVTEMMRRNEATFRAAIPGFRADQLLGVHADIFYSNPIHQRRLIESLTAPYKMEIKFSGMSFDLVATPLFDAKRQRVGTVVEWYDRTDQDALQKQQNNSAKTAAQIAASGTQETAAGNAGLCPSVEEPVPVEGATRIEEITPQNLTLVEQAAAVEETLTGQAQQLIDLLSLFLIADTVKRQHPLLLEHGNPSAQRRATRTVAATPRVPSRASHVGAADDESDPWQEF